VSSTAIFPNNLSFREEKTEIERLKDADKKIITKIK